MVRGRGSQDPTSRSRRSELQLPADERASAPCMPGARPEPRGTDIRRGRARRDQACCVETVGSSGRSHTGSLRQWHSTKGETGQIRKFLHSVEKHFPGNRLGHLGETSSEGDSVPRTSAVVFLLASPAAGLHSATGSYPFLRPAKGRDPFGSSRPNRIEMKARRRKHPTFPSKSRGNVIRPNAHRPTTLLKPRAALSLAAGQSVRVGPVPSRPQTAPRPGAAPPRRGGGRRFADRPVGPIGRSRKAPRSTAGPSWWSPP